MIQLLFALTIIQMGLVLTLQVFPAPARKAVAMGLDLMKQGKGLLVAKTVAATLFVVFLSSLYNLLKIRKRSMDAAAANPTDQVLLANHLLEASLMGFSLFLGLVIDRLHFHIGEHQRLRSSLKALTRQNQGKTRE